MKVFLSHPPAAVSLYYGARALRQLRAVAEVVLNPDDDDLTPQRLRALAGDADCIVSYRQLAAGEQLFASLPRLRAFVRCAVDIRNIDVDAASRHGVLVTQASAGFSAAVAEWIVGAMLALSRQLCDYVQGHRSGHPRVATMGRELRNTTLGLVGYGQIARYLDPIARALQMRLLVHDPFAAVDEAMRAPSLAHLLGAADHVVSLAAATEQTHNLFDAAAFAQMRPGSYFINASRGQLVDEAALLAALDSGHLAGAALDVGRAADQMPPVRLAGHPRVIATPHIGGLTAPAIEHQALETVQQVIDIAAGRTPAGAVNTAQAYRWKSPA